MPHSAAIPALTHPEWRERFAWLAQGVSCRGGDHAFDLGLFAPDGARRSSSHEAARRWDDLARALGFAAVIHARQPHGAEVRVHRAAPADEGLLLVADCDGHATGAEGVLLAVTVADCIPLTLVDPGRRAVAMVHAGWRGVAGGIAEEALRRMALEFGSESHALEAHLGPAICGSCYEVGPDVHAALGEDPPPAPQPIDLRSVLGRRLVRAGMRADALTVSTWCTCCSPELFSHRGGDAGRQAAFAGVRAP